MSELSVLAEAGDLRDSSEKAHGVELHDNEQHIGDWA
jgi:hypothetical protein